MSKYYFIAPDLWHEIAACIARGDEAGARAAVEMHPKKCFVIVDAEDEGASAPKPKDT